MLAGQQQSRVELAKLSVWKLLAIIGKPAAREVEEGEEVEGWKADSECSSSSGGDDDEAIKWQASLSAVESLPRVEGKKRSE